MSLYKSSAYADIDFRVDGLVFKSHKNVLAERCATLLELADEANGKEVQIEHIEKSTFQCLLEYIYTVHEPILASISDARDILVAANRFGVTGLKLLAEAVIVDDFLNHTTAAGLFILADCHSCALLREMAMETIATDMQAVMESDVEWSKLQESNDFLAEILRYTNIDRKRMPSENPKIEDLRVVDLRDRLQEAGEDVDGTKQVLIQRLKALEGSDESEEEDDNDS